jgi:DedD protein
VSDFSNDATDDGFHEIQLSGKQLVFLFMATTVVSVVIFLCGVLVGRGVRGEALSANTNKPTVTAAGVQPTTPPEGATSTAPPLVTESATAQPSADGLSYTKRLTDEKAVAENLKAPKAGAPAQPAVATAPQSPSVAESEPALKNPTPKGTMSSAAPAASTSVVMPRSEPDTAPASGVWAVQVVALNDRAAAQAVVTRLSGKGYNAFLVEPGASAAVKNYKVQIGRFEDRAKAQDIANRLKREEQFEPWILR